MVNQPTTNAINQPIIGTGAPQENVPHSGGGSSYRPVNKQTLWSVAVKFSKERNVSVEQMLIAIYTANPNAFQRNNVFGLMSGKTLQIPERKEIVRISPAQANAEYALQKKAWKSGVTLPYPNAVVAKQEVVNEPVLTPANTVNPEISTVAPVDNSQKKITEQPLVTPETAKQLATSSADTVLLNKVATLEKQLKATKKALATKEKKVDTIKNEAQVIVPEVISTAIPSEAVKPVAPIEVVKPSIPLQVIKPATSFELIQPVVQLEAIKPATPIEAIKPIVPAEVVKPVAPIEAIKPVVSAEVVKPVAPIEAIKPVVPAEVVKPVAPIEAIKPVVPAEVVKPVAPIEAIKPVVPAEVVKPVAPIEAIKPIVPAEVVKPVAPIEAIKPVVPAEVTKDESVFMELSDPYYLIVGGGGLGLLSMLGVVWWRNRKRAIEGWESPASTKVELKGTQPVVSEDNLSGSINASFNSPEIQGQSTFGDWDSFDIDTEQNDIDPISEADVYLAYGRYQQAEELMRDAIKEQPDRDECKLKLLEIFYASENRDAFEAYAGKLAGEGKKGDVDFWEKVMEMGSEICPDSTLLITENNVSQTTSKSVSGSNATNATTVSDVSLVKTDMSDFDDFALDDAKAEVVAVATETPALDSKDDFESINSSNVIDFDFDFDMPATGVDEQGSNFDSPDLNDMDEMETKLDLARAYIDMGDAQAAKDITEEVFKKGSAEQKKLAEAILEFLK
ncbi:MAG: FimV/HubP family polar landmark protein [Methylococcales bacterium]